MFVIRTPGYSQSISTPSRPLSLTKLAIFFAIVSRLAGLTPSRKTRYVLGFVENSQPPIERILLGPWRPRKTVNSYELKRSPTWTW